MGSHYTTPAHLWHAWPVNPTVAGHGVSRVPRLMVKGINSNKPDPPFLLMGNHLIHLPDGAVSFGGDGAFVDE